MDFKSIIICIIFLVNANLYSQEDFFIYEKIQKEKVSGIEKKYNSKEEKATVKHVSSDKNFAQPIIFSRPPTSILGKSKIYYFYSKNDAIIKQISYVWNVKEMSDKEKFFEIYGREFDKIVAIISKDIDKPQSIQDIVEKEDLIETETHFERETVWENDKCQITTLLLWSKNHNVLFTTTINMKN